MLIKQILDSLNLQRGIINYRTKKDVISFCNRLKNLSTRKILTHRNFIGRSGILLISSAKAD